MGNLENMTDRQRAAWSDAVKEIARYNVEVQESPDGYLWHFAWQEESRPGRGQSFSALFIDGEHYAQVMMDVYGYPIVSVAALDIMHSSSDEECPCEFCEAERWEEYTDEERAEIEAAAERVLQQRLSGRIPRHPELVGVPGPRGPQGPEGVQIPMDPEVKAKLIETNYAVAPGEYLREWMQENQISVVTLAHFLTWEVHWLKRVLKGKHPVDFMIAKDLALITKIPAESWLAFQEQYDKDKERLKKTFWKRVLASFLRR